VSEPPSFRETRLWISKTRTKIRALKNLGISISASLMRDRQIIFYANVGAKSASMPAAHRALPVS
jgi:hypothetical protein